MVQAKDEKGRLSEDACPKKNQGEWCQHSSPQNYFLFISFHSLATFVPLFPFLRHSILLPLLLSTFTSLWPPSLLPSTRSLTQSHQSPQPPLSRTRPLPANVSRMYTPSSAMTSSPTFANTICRRNLSSITDVCVTHAYMPQLRCRPNVSIVQPRVWTTMSRVESLTAV